MTGRPAADRAARRRRNRPATFSFVHEGGTLIVKQRADIRPARRNFLLVHGIGVSSRYFERLAVRLATQGHVHNVGLGQLRPRRAGG